MKPIRGGLLSSVGGALLLLALSPAISWATFPGANGRVAFVGHPEPTARSDIFSVLPGGAGLQQLTNTGGRGELDPSWSADGQRLVYIGKLGGVFTMRADGSHQRLVTFDNGMTNSSPGFSPSGRRIVYAQDNLEVADSDTPRRLSILKVRPDGRKKRRLVTGYVSAPTFSPGGNRIVFQGDPKGKQFVYGVWTIRPDGSGLRRLTDPERDGWDYDTALDWSPNGRHILFQRCNSVSRYELCDDWMMRRDGSHKHPVEGTGFDTVYSPSGRRFVFSISEYDGLSTWCSDVYTNSLAGSDPRDLTRNCEDFHNGGPSRYAFQPSWQPIPQP
jgi:Tol biopolymer transport system component